MSRTSRQSTLISLTALASAPLLASLLALGACGQDTSAQPIRNLDRPSEIAFACYGDLRVDGAAISSAQVLSSCIAHQNGEPPEGQEALVPPEFFGFVLQPARGTVAVVNVRALGVQDNDPLTPGLNDIPVGTLPVGMAEDASGCHIMTANSGSCDLAAINVDSALNLSRNAEVNRVAIFAPNGDQLLARPRSITAGPQIEEIGQVCPLTPQGNLFIAYPDCNLVAAVDPATGQIQNGLAFRSTGAIELATDADFAACPVQCGDSIVSAGLNGTEPETFNERPVSLEVSKDGSQLYITSESSPFFTIVDLDEAGLPTATIKRLRVTGDVGLTNFAVSEPIEMGGDVRGGEHLNLPVEAVFRFVYAIATDSTIRVLDLEREIECDTQVDPRNLGTEEDVEFLSCMPVGDIRTPARRIGARGPGIQLPGALAQGRNGQSTIGVPLDIAIATVPTPQDLPAVAGPDAMTGTFAFVTAASGQVFVVNVDDDNYADVEEPGDPIAVSMPLAIAHQLRDNVTNRDALSSGCGTQSSQRGELGARLMDSPSQIIDPSQVASNKLHELPFLRGLPCEGEDNLGNPVETIITELSFAADAAIRELAYPDLRLVENQQWTMSWEGSLSSDNIFVNIDGPPIRKGIVARDGEVALLQDSNDPFCALGVEPFDIASLLGCDPLLDDLQCGVGEECFRHPETSFSIQSGVCVPKDKVDSLASTCLEFFRSRRRFSVSSSAQGELELIERRRMLRTTPIDGCESASQCSVLADAERVLSLGDHPIEAELDDPPQDFSWVCEPDPSRKAGVDRCVMSCDSSDDCEDGFSCSEQRCVEAPLPPAECLASVQRYQLLAGEAFVVVGADDGFIHDIVADPDTGACIPAASPHPLAVGRIPLRPEPCDDDGDFATGPNPCSTTISHTESYIPFELNGDICVEQDRAVRTREAPAVHFSNPSLSFHLVDTESRGDLNCRNDQLGEGPFVGTPYAGYQIILDVGGGFLPKTVPNLEAALPIKIVPGPAGRFWILDQGDVSAITRGRLFRINPTEPGGFDLTTIL